MSTAWHRKQKEKGHKKYFHVSFKVFFTLQCTEMPVTSPTSLLSLQDMNSGLIGPLIICRKGVLNKKGLRADIDREFATLFMIFNENESWYLDENIEKYLRRNPKEFHHTHDFEEGNMKHGTLFTMRILFKHIVL